MARTMAQQCKGKQWSSWRQCPRRLKDMRRGLITSTWDRLSLMYPSRAYKYTAGHTSLILISIVTKEEERIAQEELVLWESGTQKQRGHKGKELTWMGTHERKSKPPLPHPSAPVRSSKMINWLFWIKILRYHFKSPDCDGYSAFHSYTVLEIDSHVSCMLGGALPLATALALNSYHSSGRPWTCDLYALHLLLHSPHYCPSLQST